MSLADEIAALYATRGRDAYFGEAVSMCEHALQAAHFARAAGATEPLAVAALLHDIGHLLAPVPADIGDWTHDARHELSGASWLAARFPPAVHAPVRLHVAAKRYLCATDESYRGRLSPASVHTLALQGGPLSAAEVAQFEAEPWWREALQLRRWDDCGKVAGLATASFADWLPAIGRVALPAGPTHAA